MSSMIAWLIIGVLCIVFDLCTSLFLFCWISIGSFGAIICNLLGFGISIQIIVFALLSVISTIIGYNLVTKRLKKSVKRVELMEETFIGKTFTADQDISDKVTLKLDGSFWIGENTGDKILKGQEYKITAIKGNKFLICKC